MALSIKDPETDRLAHAVARATGEKLTTAIRIALAERLERLRSERTGAPELEEEIRSLQQYVATLPDRDSRSPDEILGYDESGLPR